MRRDGPQANVPYGRRIGTRRAGGSNARGRRQPGVETAYELLTPPDGASWSWMAAPDGPRMLGVGSSEGDAMSRNIVALVTALLVLTGCASRSSGSAAPSAADRPLLAFTATTVDGRPFDGMSLAGKPAVLWFWAPWCPTCLQQAPGVRATAQRFVGVVNVVGVAGLDKAAAMPEFVRLAKVGGIPHIADAEGVLWKRFGVLEQSWFVFIDASGGIVGKGVLDGDKLADKVAELLVPTGA
jgi:thiol-disulfide isomerase/thioredoxin